MLTLMVVVVMAAEKSPQNSKERVRRSHHDANDNDNDVECPPPCFCSKTGSTVNCMGKKLTSIPPGIPYQVEMLYLDGNLITELPVGSLKNFTLLTSVYLRNNKLNKVAPFAFRSLTQLQNLYLGNNNIQTLHPDVFAETPALKYLSLSSNELTTIPDLQHLHQLQSLVLDANHITDATFPATSASLPALNSIVLSNNKIPELTNSTFEALRNSSVRKLEIARNGLKNVSIGALKPLVALQSLKIGYNPLDGEQLQHVLEGLREDKNLESLDIRSIGLGGTLPSVTFSILSGTPLRSLIFNNNVVKTIPANAFAHLPKLVQLDLSSCQITSVDDAAFVDLPELQVLFLNYNVDLSDVPNNLPASLLKLYLQGNNVAQLPGRKFANLTSLRELYFSDNKMLQVVGDSFFGLTKLRILHLNNNKLSYIPKELFGPLTSLNTLILKNNNLQNLKINPGSLSSLVALQTLDMSGNQCSYLPLDYLSELTSLQTLLLDGNNLRGVFVLDESGSLLGNLRKLQKLSLSSNFLGYIHDAQFKNMLELKELNLSHNQMSFWGPDLFHTTRTLSTLDLSYNQVALVNKTSVRDLSSLTTLNLFMNPFACTCDLVWFCGWLNSTTVKLRNVTHYKCNSPSEWNGKSLLSFCDAHIDCTDYMWYYVGGAIGVTVIVVVIVTTIVYRQRWFLWLRFYRMQKSFRRAFLQGQAARNGYEPVTGNDRKYDFYVISSEDDIEWVHRELIPRLENTPNQDGEPEHPQAEGDPLTAAATFKLYFEDRDATLGMNRIKNFEESMPACRAVLVVLTRNLEGDAWCHFLLEQAEELKVDGKIDRIQVVKVGRVTKIPRRLDRMMQNNDYREWPDRDNVIPDFMEHLHDNLQKNQRNQPLVEHV